VRRRARVLAGSGLALILGAAPALGASPSWHAPTYPSAPSGGAVPTVGFRLGLAAGASGKATLLYQAKANALYAVSRSSTTGAWGSAQPWLASAAIAGPPPAGQAATGGLATVAGKEVTGLWVDTSGRLRTASGSGSAGGSAATVGTPAGEGVGALGLAPAGSALAVSFATAGPAGGAVSGGAMPVGGTAAIPAIAATAPGPPTALQTAVDGSGNQTAVWRGRGNSLEVATRPAGSAQWTAGAPLVGSSASATPFALAVNPSGSAAVAFVTDVTTGAFGSPPITYQASATLVVVQRPSATAPFGPAQTLGRYAPPPPTTSQAAIALQGITFPRGVTAAAGGGKLVVGWVAQPGGEFGAPTFFVTRGALGTTLPSGTPFADPKAGDASENGWDLVGLASAVDPKGTAGVLFAGAASQGAQDGVWATTSTANVPQWTGVRDIAKCKDSSAGVAGPALAAAPSSGLVAAWGCLSSTPAASTGQKLVGLAAFDTSGPPVVSFTTKGAKATFTLGESASYSLTAVKGAKKVTGSGSATAYRAVTRTLKLSSGTWTVTLKATRSGGASTSTSRTATVS
jgi:hypothetical protein